MTHRQFNAWTSWTQHEWNVPDRHDHYMMQVAAEVRTGRGVKDVTLEKVRIPFKFVKPARALTDAEKRAAMEASKAAWATAFGVGVDNGTRVEVQIPR